MGRGRGRGKRVLSRDFKQPRDSTWAANSRTNWHEIVQHNEAFDEYYKEQGICPPEEWDAMMATLRTQLPLTFRINGSGKFADALRCKLETDFLAGFGDTPIEVEGELIKPPVALPWYPAKLAWQMEFTRSQLRKLPALEALHEFMKLENEVGGITRQEAVSMVPPLFMDVQPQHRVLDMCAAPGSKTVQLLEMLHRDGAEPGGVVVANDADAQRCNMLTHQTQRIRSPALVITNHEAQIFPLVPDLDPASPDSHILYDRILCDVPCSGDGTLRKQPDIWRRWSPANGNGLHNLQVRIALRACELLRVGGRMVYSTCTFNPVEDEAAVAEVLRRTKGAMELVDVSGELPQLRRCAGLSTWKVRDKQRWYTRWEGDGQEGHKLQPSMFPDEASAAMPLHRCMRFLPHHQDTGGFFVAVLQKLAPLQDLQYPVMERKQPTKRKRDVVEGAAEAGGEAAETADNEGVAGENEAAVEPVAEEVDVDAAAAAEQPAGGVEPEGNGAVEGEPAAVVAVEAAPASAPQAPPVKGLPEWGARAGAGGDAAGPNRPEKRSRWGGVDPIFAYVNADQVAAIAEFYGLAPECPIQGSLVARSEEVRPKKLTYVSRGVRLLLLTDVHAQMKVTAAGVKLLERQDNKDNLLSCPYRLAQEGMACVLPYIQRQRFEPSVEEYLALLQDRVVGLPEESKLHITKERKPEAAPDADTTPDLDTTLPDADAAAGEAVPAAEGEEAAAVEPPQEAKPEKSGWPKPQRTFTDPATLAQMPSLSYGCCVAMLRDADAASLGFTLGSEMQGSLAANMPLAISCWRGRGSMNVLVSKQECAQVIERLQAAMAARDKAAQATTA